MALPPLTYVSWFSGGGGLDLAVRILFPLSRCIGLVEIEAPAVEILAARMEEGSLEEAPVYSDIGTWPGRLYRGRVDLAIFGAPCQPYSAAGKRLGESDERYLWPHIFRAIDECQPALVYLENVPGLLRFYRPIGERLSELGYQAEGLLSSAEEVGAPHKRLRLFVLAVSERAKRRAGIKHEQLQGGRVKAAGGPGSHSRALGHAERARRDGAAGHGLRVDGPPLPASRSGETCGAVEHAGSANRRQGVSVCAGREALGDGGGAVADSGHRFIPLAGPGPQGRNGSGSAGEERELREPSERDGLTAGSGGELEDPARRNGPGSERGLRIGRGVCETGGELEPPSVFPPHRTGAWEEWQAVLRTRWWLRPALGSFDQFYHSLRRAGLLPVGLAADPVFASEEWQARIAAEVGKALRKAGLSQKIKRVLRPLAHGMESAVGVSRIDSLRALGNGVVPVSAAFAFVLLAEQLQIGEWDGEQLRIR